MANLVICHLLCEKYYHEEDPDFNHEKHEEHEDLKDLLGLRVLRVLRGFVVK